MLIIHCLMARNFPHMGFMFSMEQSLLERLLHPDISRVQAPH
jgi:hypothetical protein